MKHSYLFVVLALLGLFMGSCRTTSPKFQVKVVDSVSNKPMTGVEMEYREHHWGAGKMGEIGRKIYVENKSDAQGMISVGRHNLYSRDCWLDLRKSGYWSAHIHILRFGHQVRVTVQYKNTPPNPLGGVSPEEEILLSRGTVVEVPMRRK